MDGASHLASMLQTMLYLSDSRGEKLWTPPVLMVTAAQNLGIGDLYDAIQNHRSKMAETNQNEIAKRSRLKSEIEHLMKLHISKRVFEKFSLEDKLNEKLDAISNRNLNPYEWAEQEINTIFSKHFCD